MHKKLREQAPHTRSHAGSDDELYIDVIMTTCAQTTTVNAIKITVTNSYK